MLKAPFNHPLARHPLALKLAIVTAIKLAGLFIIWWAFFSGHGTHDITPDQAAKAVLHPGAGYQDFGKTSK